MGQYVVSISKPPVAQMFFQHCLLGFDTIQCQTLSGVRRETRFSNRCEGKCNFMSEKRTRKVGKDSQQPSQIQERYSLPTALLKTNSRWFLINPLLLNSHCPCKFSSHCTGNGLWFYGRSVASFQGISTLSFCSSQSDHSCKCFGLFKILDLQCQTHFYEQMNSEQC